MTTQTRIWLWDTLGWIKAFAGVQIVGNTIFIILLMIAVSFIVKSDSHCAIVAIGGEAVTAMFIMLIFLIFLSMVGIGMAILLLRGSHEILENDSYLKAWIVYTAITLIVVLACAVMVGFLGITMLRS